MLFALFGTCITDISAELADRISVLASVGHQFNSRFTNSYTFQVEANAICHFVNILFLQAGRRTMITHCYTFEACIDAGFISHIHI
jgi:hypothetical protein